MHDIHRAEKRENRAGERKTKRYWNRVRCLEKKVKEKKQVKNIGGSRRKKNILYIEGVVISYFIVAHGCGCLFR